MLELRPNCELCDKDLPPGAVDARICTYECTFCAACVEDVLHDVCPNCGGGFEPRPIRPARAWRDEHGLVNDPPGRRRRDAEYTRAEIDGVRRDAARRAAYRALEAGGRRRRYARVDEPFAFPSAAATASSRSCSRNGLTT